MLPPGLQSPREVTLYYNSIYEDFIESGNAVPFLYPWAGLGAFVVFIYLLIDHRQSPTLKSLRVPIFGFLCAFQAWCITTNRAKNPAAAFGVGILSAWGTVWVSALMISNDCQSDFARVERVDEIRDRGKHDGMMNGYASANGNVHDQNVLRNAAVRLEPLAGGFCWQTFPSTVAQRLDWIVDLFCSFRGVGWDWQTSSIPHVQQLLQSNGAETAQIEPQVEIAKSRSGIRRFNDRTALLKANIISLSVGYLVLDLVWTIMHHDPYFWGYTNAAAPSHLPRQIQNSNFLLKSYRLLICLAGMYFPLWYIFKSGPVFFCGILGPKWIGLRGEACMNPADMFGSFQCVLDQGLAGWWGGWWHQTFRYSFESPAMRIVELLGIEKKSNQGRLVSLSLAFFLSGCVHAAGSYTQLGVTRPLLGPMRFFLLQPFGIVAQFVLAHWLKKIAILQRTPKLLVQLTNFVYVHAWLYFTAPLLVDDFAKGGLFLFEPVAISPLRALELGAKDDSWFCWWNGILFWRSGKTWWDTGLAV